VCLYSRCRSPNMSVTRSRAPQSADVAPAGLRKKYLDGEKGVSSKPRRVFSPAMNMDSMLHARVIPGPDIEWNPSYETYRARVESLSKMDILRPQKVPEGFPETVDAPRVWSTTDFEDDSKYIVSLNESEIAEIERALAFFKGCGIEYEKI